MTPAAMQRMLDQLLTRMRDLEAEVARLRRSVPEPRIGVEACIVSLETEDTPASPMGSVDEDDDTQTVDSGNATVMEFDDNDKLVPIQNADREQRETLTYWNAARDAAPQRAGAGECFLVLRLRDGRWIRVSSGSTMLRFTLLEDCYDEEEHAYYCDIYTMAEQALTAMGQVIDTYGWMASLQLRAGDTGLCVRDGGKVYFVTSDCGSGSDCTEGPFVRDSEADDGEQGTPYSWTPTASGTDPEEWTGAGLPDGLTIDTDTGEITGTPTEAGEFLMTISATTEGCTSTRIVKLIIAEPPPP